MDTDDDDRTYVYENNDQRKSLPFKVPKKNLKNKCSYEKVLLQSNDFKDNIYPKIVTSYKNPNSCTSLKILSAYTICNPDVEKSFMKRKQTFKKDFSLQSASECFGFIFLSNLAEFKNIVSSGKIRNGNLKESVLGKPDMGVCVSMFSDVYHPGDGKSFPRNGILLVVKYLKGRVYYVVEDINPMEPQPNYDCHISKNYNQESFPSMGRAFHSTQVYLYEYSDDFDLEDEPNQILPWAAIEFTWVGNPLYKLIVVPISVSNNGDIITKDSSAKSLDKRLKSSNRISVCPPQRIKQMYIDSNPVFCTQLQLKLPKIKKSDDLLELSIIDIPITILSYHSLWNPFDPLISSSWQLCELMEWSAFEKGFIQPLMRDNSNEIADENFSISNVFNKRITISRNQENKFNKNMLDPVKLSTFGTQYINYFRMVINDPSRDRAKMARLIEHFLETKTVGRIRINDNSDTLLFVFPDSNLSQNFGIPSVRTLDVNYLHLLLVTNRSLDYNLANRHINEFVEIEIKTKLSNMFLEQGNKDVLPLISLNVLKQTVSCQNSIQKSKLRQICGISTNLPLKFEEINFKSCADPVTNNSDENDSLLHQKVCKSQNPNQKIDSPSSDRPYDPTENLFGLSDSDSSKINNLKRSIDSKKSEESLEHSQIKKSKREDMKNELNTKLFQLFAKIENTDSADVIHENSNDNFTASSNAATKSNYYQYASTLDRNKFQTQFRHGVSVYVPESNNICDQRNSMDKDFRYQDPLNQQYIYSDSIVKPNGFNR